MEDGDLLAGGLASILQVTKFDTFEEKNGLVMQTRRIEPDTMSTVQQAMVVMRKCLFCWMNMGIDCRVWSVMPSPM